MSRVVVGAASVLGLLDPAWVQQHQVPVLAVGFLLGLPHGAVDHLLPRRHGWVRPGRTSTGLVIGGYVGLALLTWAGLRTAGPVVLPLLLAVSVLHFGAGDLAAAGPQLRRPARAGRETTGARVTSLGRGLLDAASRGAPVVAGPLLAWSGPTLAALDAVGLGSGAGRTAAVGVGVALLVLSVAGAGLAIHRGRPGDALEIGLLVALFVALPPLAAFGVYFGAWHGLRHTARLLADDRRSAADLARGRVVPAVGRFLRDAALPSLVALGATVALVWVAAGHAGLAAPVFQLLLALTVPHVVVVGLWDHRERRRQDADLPEV